MARSVQESDLSQRVLAVRVRERNGVSADVLSDAAGFARSDVGLANDVEQGGFAVVNVAHNGDDWRARDQVLGFIFNVKLDLFLVAMDLAAAAVAPFDFKAVAVFGADFLRDGFFDGLVD